MSDERYNNYVRNLYAAHSAILNAMSELERAGTQRWEVYEYIRTKGELGATFSEIQDAVGRGYNSVGPRVRELKHDGHVSAAGSTRAGNSGAQQEVWVAVPHAPAS